MNDFLKPSFAVAFMMLLGAALFSLAVICHLIVIGLDWRRGEPPRTMETNPAPLEGELQ